MSKRVFLIVLDSAGIGEAPDADRFDDVGCDTMGTCVRSGKLHVLNINNAPWTREFSLIYHKNKIWNEHFETFKEFAIHHRFCPIIELIDKKND